MIRSFGRSQWWFTLGHALFGLTWAVALIFGLQTFFPARVAPWILALSLVPGAAIQLLFDVNYLTRPNLVRGLGLSLLLALGLSALGWLVLTGGLYLLSGPEPWTGFEHWEVLGGQLVISYLAATFNDFLRSRQSLTQIYEESTVSIQELMRDQQDVAAQAWKQVRSMSTQLRATLILGIVAVSIGLFAPGSNRPAAGIIVFSLVIGYFYLYWLLSEQRFEHLLFGINAILPEGRAASHRMLFWLTLATSLGIGFLIASPASIIPATFVESFFRAMADLFGHGSDQTSQNIAAEIRDRVQNFFPPTAAPGSAPLATGSNSNFLAILQVMFQVLVGLLLATLVLWPIIRHRRVIWPVILAWFGRLAETLATIFRRRPRESRATKIWRPQSPSALAANLEIASQLGGNRRSFNNAILEIYANFLTLLTEAGMSLGPADTPGTILEKAHQFTTDVAASHWAREVTNYFLSEAFGPRRLDEAEVRAMQQAFDQFKTLFRGSRPVPQDS